MTAILASLGSVVLVLLAWSLLFANRRGFPWTPPAPAPDLQEGGVTRTTLLIPTPSGERIEAWLYHPGRRAPLVILAPGLCGTKEGPLEGFALAFAKAGFCALSFDFRTFGGSEGMPRHDIDPRGHIADFVAVADHARSALAEQVDIARIALWGTSFSAAAALCAASRLSTPPSALILHVPYLGRPARPPDGLQLAGYVALTLAEMAGDRIAGWFGVKLPPAYIAAYGRPGERAFGASRDCPSRRGDAPAHPFWQSLPATYRGGWRNLCLVRGLQHLDAVDVEAAFAENRIPSLVVAATDDDMVRIEDTRAMCARSQSCHLTEIAGAHFDPYCEPWFGPNIERQTAFLRAHLGGAQDIRAGSAL